MRGGTNTYSYVGGNPVSNYDPLGLVCSTINGFLYCTFPSGSPTVRVPIKPGFPNSMGVNDFGDFLNHHTYQDEVPLDGADRQCVMQKLIDEPTPGNPNPATREGTRNNARVPPFDNNVTSFLTTDINTGGQVVVNMTDSNSLFSPGYVMRYVSKNNVYTLGEGLHWSQSMWSPLPHEIGNYLIWKRQMQRFVEECKCKK
jgi:hypothetical protein